MQLNHSDKDKTTKEWNITAFFKLTLSVLPFPNVSTWLHSQGTHLIWEILSLCAVLLPLPSVSQLGTTVAGKHPLTHFFNSFSNPITPQNVRRDWNHFLLLTIIQNTEKKTWLSTSGFLSGCTETALVLACGRPTTLCGSGWQMQIKSTAKEEEHSREQGRTREEINTSSVWQNDIWWQWGWGWVDGIVNKMQWC